MGCKLLGGADAEVNTRDTAGCGNGCSPWVGGSVLNGKIGGAVYVGDNAISTLHLDHRARKATPGQAVLVVVVAV